MSPATPKIENLRAAVRGRVLEPRDPAYDASREIWNRSFDRRPRLIVRCTSASDVAAAIRFTQENGLKLALKCGGHHSAGHASIDDGVLLDLSGLRAIEIHPEQRLVRAQTGLTWAHFDQVTQAFGLATTGPIVSMVGLAGFTLGGGVGWLHRKLGLACDTLRSVELVTADGSVVTASETERPELLWGIRGSGWNFGVVTAMEFQVTPVGPQVTAGLIYFPLELFPVVAERYQSVLAGLPDELTTWLFLRLAPPVPAIPKEWVGRPVVAIAMCHCGPAADGLRWAEELAAFGRPIANTVGTVEYRLWQKSLDGRWGNGFYNDWRGHYLAGLSSETVSILMDRVSRLESPWTDIKIVHLEGAVGRIPETATAFGNRSAKFALVIQARWERETESEAMVRWAKDLRDALSPYATGGVYSNFIAADEGHRVPSAHGPQNYRRLQAIKREYDPGNLFDANPNVPPE